MNVTGFVALTYCSVSPSAVILILASSEINGSKSNTPRENLPTFMVSVYDCLTFWAISTALRSSSPEAAQYALSLRIASALAKDINGVAILVPFIDLYESAVFPSAL